MTTFNAVRSAARTIGLCLAALCALSGCDQRSEDERIAAAVAGFHELYNQQEFDRIYTDASSLYRRKVSRTNHDRLMAALYREYGSVKSSRRDAIKVDRSTGLIVIGLFQTTTFEHSVASEFFGFRMSVTEPGIKLIDYARQNDGGLPRR